MLQTRKVGLRTRGHMMEGVDTELRTPATYITIDAIV